MVFMPEKLLMAEWPNVLPTIGVRITSLGKENPELKLR